MGQTGNTEISGTLQIDDITEKTSAHGVDIEGVIIKNNGVTAGSNGTISASNFNVGSKNVISASAQGSFTDLEIKSSGGNIGLLVMGQTGNTEISGTLEVSSDISFNGNLYQNGSLFTSGGGGGLTDLSATSISDLSDVSLNGIQVNQTLKWDGEKLIPTTLATTDIKQGQVLETITGVCDGRTVVVDSGSYTLGNVTAYQDTTHTGWTDVTGSSISYTPPTGSTQVIFEFHLNLSTNAATSDRAILLFKLLIDGVSVTSQDQAWGDSTSTYGENIFYRGIIDITGTDDVANGKLSSWTSNKTLKLQVVNYDTYAGRLHANYLGGLPGDVSVTDTLIKPRLKITSIGKTTGQSVTLTTNSVSDLSDVSFNPISTTNGQALVWNSTDSGVGSGGGC